MALPLGCAAVHFEFQEEKANSKLSTYAMALPLGCAVSLRLADGFSLNLAV